jgi:large repetitive protein
MGRGFAVATRGLCVFASKTFHKMAPYGRTTAAIWLLIGTMLASPLALAQTQVQNTARVDSTDGTTDPNTPNNVSTVTNDVYAVTVAKSANPASGASVRVGGTISYTLTVTATGATTTSPATFTDTLSAGLALVAGSLPSQCTASGQTITCTLPAGSAIGTYTFAYQATVVSSASGSVSNSVTGGNGCTTSGGCTTTHTALPAAATSKTANTAGPVKVGDTITYTLSTEVLDTALVSAYPLTDTLGTGLTFGSVTSAGAYTCNASGNVLSCTLPAGTAPGTYVATYTATVNDQATGTVSNAVVSDGCTSGCAVVVPVQDPVMSTRKTADTAGPVSVGDTITYTLTTDVSNSRLTVAYPLTDTLGTGLTFGSVTNAGAYTCSASGNVLSCTLPIGTVPGSYAVTYTATVNNQALSTTGVTNSVSSTGCTGDCDVVTPVEAPATSTRKTANTAGPVSVGDTITYTLTTDVSNSQLIAAYPLTDTLGAGLTFGSVTSTGGHTCSSSGNVLSCTLPAGTVPGTYAVTYTATVNNQAVDRVRNTVSGTGCTNGCDVLIPVNGATSTRKTADTAGPVKVGDTITYTLTTVVSNTRLTAAYPLTDTLGTGLTFGSVTNAGAYSCSASGNVLNCTLPSGTLPGTYVATYTATVNSQATSATGVSNAVVSAGCTSECDVVTPVQAPATSTRKTADTAGPVKVGDTITYTLTTDVSNSALVADYPLTDMLDTGLTFGSVTSAGGHTCSASGNVLNCTLPSGTAAGTYAVTYTATVNNQAADFVRNTVTGAGCTSDCDIIIPTEAAAATTRKTADTAGPVAVGDTITYTLTTVVANGALTATYPVTDTLGTGLTFGAVTSAGGHTCSASGNVLSCTLPTGTAPGTYAVRYTTTVNSQASGSVTNAFTAPGCISDCEVIIPVGNARTAKIADTTGPVTVGDTITYTLTTVVSGSALTATYPVTDTLGTGLTFGAVTSAGGHTCSASGNVLSCTLPAGTAPGTYAVTYTATVNSQASGSVTNTFTAPGCISDCEVLIPVEGVSTAKTADTTGPVTVGDTITYTLTTVVSGNALTTTYPVTDTLGTGLTFGAVTSAGGHTCSASGNVLSCTLPAGTAPGTYAVTYTATVNSQASGSVTNTFTAPGCISNCEVIIPVGNARTDKTADTTGPVAVGDTITYTLTTVVSNSALTATYPVTDTLGTGLTFGAVTSAGGHTCAVSGNVLNCTLPAGTAPGTYAVTYTATVNSQASGSVTNTFTAPGCIIDCEVIIPVGNARTAKTANTTGPVAVGDTITYTLTTVVSNSALTATYPVTDTLGTGLTFGSVTSAGGHSCAVSGNVLSCTLPAGTTPGTYAVTYTATVNSQASGSVTNTFTAPGCISDCEVIIPVGNARTVKTADTAGPVTVGNTITYTLTTVVSNAALTAAYPITDTLGTGLTFGAVTSAGGHTCSASGNVLNCTLPAGTAPGTYAVTYTATVNSQASGSVTNRFTAPGCISDCGVIIPLADQRVTYRKAADTAGPVKPDDTITYTLTMEVSGSRLTAAYTLTDTLGTGLTFGAVTSTGAYTCGTSGSVLTCTLPAGTAPGTYAVTYTATVNAQAGDSVSNAVTATGPVQPVCVGECTVDIDVTAPVRVTKVAGVSEAKVGDLVRYAVTVENNGTIDVVNGYAVDIPPAGFTYVEGSLRVSGADTQVMVSGQSPLRFDGIDVPVGQSATLTYLMRVGAGVRQGVQVNQVRVYSEQGQPISNVATAEVTVTGDPLLDDSLIFGTVFNDRNGDGWQDNDEPGIPGVRIASVDGLLIETDPFGRYHLAGVAGGAWERGRNFILKVDPSTLPAGTEFTTDNPLLRRITPGVPVRFDWGVKLLEQVIEGGTRQDELALGEVIYLPGSAELRSEYLPTIEKMAAKVREYGGGEVVIQANGQTERFALARAEAVRDALLPLLDPATAKAVTVSVRGIVDDPGSLWVGVDGDGVTLGTVLFDTDKSAIRPEFKPMLEQVANRLERMGGGSIAIIGHTDIRASHAYNTALGMRRAKAVYEALTQRLSPEVRSKVRVEAINDPKAAIEHGVH